MSRLEPAGPTPFQRMDGEPVFDEPWQAQLLALADSLVTQGAIAPADWSQRLGRELETAIESGAPDDMATYYGAVLRTLEGLLEARNDLSGAEVQARRDAWAEAYRSTPHGQPVELKAKA